MISHKLKTLFLSIFLVAGVLFQVWNLFGLASQDLIQVRNAIGQSGLWRSANFAQGQKFANYVHFLHENIPEEGRVVLPPEGVGPKSLSATPYMQFFLAPRQVINCSEAACLENLSTENTYILAVRGFPSQFIGSLDGDLRMFDDQWGVVLPKDARPGNLVPFQGFKNLLELGRALFWALLWLLIVTASGGFLVNYLVPGWGRSYKLALGYGIGLGVLSLGMAIAALVGLSIDRSLVFALTLFLLLASLIIFLLTRGWNSMDRPRLSALRRIDLWIVVFLVFGGLAAVLSVGKGYHTVDAIQIWGVKGTGIALAGSIASVTQWGTNTLPYPLHIPILIAAFHLLFSDVLPASKLIFSGYFTGLTIVLYLSLIELKISRRIAGLSTLLIASTPILFRHATIGYANLPLSFYLIAALLVLLQAIHESNPADARGKFLVSGFFLVVAAWTRPEGFVLACLGIVGILGITFFWPRTTSFTLRPWIPVLILISVYALFWQLIKLHAYSQASARSGLMQAAIDRIRVGDLHFEEIGYILRRVIGDLFNFEVWGVLGLGMLFVLLLALLTRGWSPRPAAFTLGCGLLWAGLITGIYYLASFDSVHDLSWWVNSGLDRMLLPALLLLWVGGISLVQLLDHREDSSTPAGSP